MSGQALDLRRSARIVRRHKALIGIAIACGLLAGASYAVLDPPAYTGSALVSLSPKANIATQRVLAASAPVLSLALPGLGSGTTLDTLHGRIQVARVAAGLISVSAQGSTPAQAVEIANAVTRSYIAYADSAGNPAGQQQAQLFQLATSATGTTFRARLVEAESAGISAGALIGVVIALAIGQNDRRLRERDEIADSIGVPVLGSLRVQHPAQARGWEKLLLADYAPTAAEAWQYRKIMRQLEVAGLSRPESPGGRSASLAVLSLASDRTALALGPRLAAFAAAQGIPAALVVGPGQHSRLSDALRAACSAASAPSSRPGRPQLMATDDGDVRQLPEGVLAVVVAVVDEHTPRVASTMRTTMTVLGVASGAATAQQLARVAASAAGDGRVIAGILVADPDAADQTTGLQPQLRRSGQHRMPTRMTSAVTEIMQ